MNDLTKLQGKSEKFTIGGEEFELLPLTVSELDLIMDARKIEKQNEALREIIKKTIKKSVPNATEEQINGIAFEHFDAIVSAILKLNKLGGDVTKKQTGSMSSATG